MWIAYFLLIIYLSALFYITVYCLFQFHLLYQYNKSHRANRKEKEEAYVLNGNRPFVTIQLPIFNEMYVVERLVDNIVELKYPKERFEIHILDDSTDETVEISRRKVEEYKAKGFQIELFHRVDRQGFKAGALKDAMKHAKGEFIAIFDADFLPRPEFLLETIPYFQDENVGVVQTRWEHLNQDYSVLTRMQAMQLNVHFTVEQKGRAAGNYFLQFNGTAGVWRKTTIEDAGGWEADTLTEDLDLSYRAQLKGWQIRYLENVGSPAELPAEMNALKSQQFRWMKGGAENARKLLPTVWRSSHLSFSQKLHATSHLMASSIFLFVFIAGVFSVPLLFLLNELNFDTKILTLSLSGLLSIILIYYVANVNTKIHRQPYLKMFFKFIFLFPLFLALSMGLSLHNSVAILQGYVGKQSPFVRTPKFNIKTIADSFKKSKYLVKKLSWTTVIEGLLAIYFFMGVVFALYLGENSFVIFHLMLMIGFGTICYYSIRHLMLK